MLYLYVFCCTGTEPKHSVSNGVLQHHTFLMCLRWDFVPILIYRIH